MAQTTKAVLSSCSNRQHDSNSPTKNSDILTAPLNQSTIGRRDINVDEGAVKMSGFIVTMDFLTNIQGKTNQGKLLLGYSNHTLQVN